MWIAVKKFLLSRNAVLGAYVLLALGASVQALLLATHAYGDKVYTEYNNYVIFKQSFYHLLAAKDLYVLYPAEYWDLYKYSPTFSLGMGALAHLPDTVGLTIWNLGNALALFGAVWLLPFRSETKAGLLWFALPELLTSMQNAQSNGLMAALLIAAWAHLEQGKTGRATLWLVVATFIKVYGAVGFCLFFLYPGKIKFIGYALLWTVLAAALPLVATGGHTLLWQYGNWARMMGEDQSASYGLSVMGWLHTWFGVSGGKGVISIVGLALFLLPLARTGMYRNVVYRLLLLAGMLIWVIIFNHKAESPTFIIAVAGAGIWYCCRPRRPWRTALMAAVFIFTCLSPTDLFPPAVRSGFFLPYTIKAVPCILLWCVILAELLLLKKDAALPERVSPEARNLAV